MLAGGRGLAGLGTPAVVVEEGTPILGAAGLRRPGHGLQNEANSGRAAPAIGGLVAVWRARPWRRRAALEARRPARRMPSSRSCTSQSGEMSPSAPLKKPTTGVGQGWLAESPAQGELRSPGKLKHAPPMLRSRLEMAKLQWQAEAPAPRFSRVAHAMPARSLE